MIKTISTDQVDPVRSGERYILLDIIRWVGSEKIWLPTRLLTAAYSLANGCLPVGRLPKVYIQHYILS